MVKIAIKLNKHCMIEIIDTNGYADIYINENQKRFYLGQQTTDLFLTKIKWSISHSAPNNEDMKFEDKYFSWIISFFDTNITLYKTNENDMFSFYFQEPSGIFFLKVKTSVKEIEIYEVK